MAQNDFGTINPATKSGTALAADLNGFRDALNSLHGGAARPAYAVAGTLWRKVVSGTTWEIYLYDGADDILFCTFNPVANDVILNIPDGSIATSKLATGGGGVVTGLNSDQVDSLHATSFVRTDASTIVAQGYSVRWTHSNNTDPNDGKIGARLFGAGLNILGSATETGDSTRYITAWGNTVLNGSLTINSSSGINATNGPIQANSGFYAVNGPIQAQNGNRIEAQGTSPKIHLHRPGGYSWTITLASDTNYIWLTAQTDGSGNGGTGKVAFSPTGAIWCANINAWISEYFLSSVGVRDVFYGSNAGAGYVLDNVDLEQSGTTVRLVRYYQYRINTSDSGGSVG